jgi:hypothetical protein
VNVELDVFCPAVMNGVGGEIDGGDVVAVDNGSLVDRTRELLKELSKP